MTYPTTTHILAAAAPQQYANATTTTKQPHTSSTSATPSMDAILNFEQDLDVSLLDNVVMAFYQGRGEEQKLAQTVLTQFQDHPNSWQRVDAILETSASNHTKFIALQILDKLIQTRWKILGVEQREGIKNYIVSLVIKKSSDETSFKNEKLFISKLNLILVQILKHEWPKNWPSFIPDICTSSRTNLTLCENNMAILKLLSEEIFDFSSEQMTTVKTNNLKQQLGHEFSSIFQLCNEVLDNATQPGLISATLKALLRFLKWIPLGYIFETPLIENLRNRFLMVPAFRNDTLACLTEIASLSVNPQYDAKFTALLQLVMESINTMLPLATVDFPSAYMESNDEDQKFIQNLALFLSNFFSHHLTMAEQSGNVPLLINAHTYLVQISKIEDRELFKICLEYWNKLVSGLYHERGPSIQTDPLMLGSQTQMLGTDGDRKEPYAPVLSALRLVMIERMVKPEEVLVVENDDGEIVREFIKETDTITLYKSMRECLVFLTHLDPLDSETIMTDKLSRQMDGSEWSWTNLNTLCWAVGSISGAMCENNEKTFLVTVIKDLLSLCEQKRGKDNKAVVASNIMYVVGQYPRFLKAHWKFLKTVVNKLFEFMHETHEGVQDMACDTFITISQKCRRYFVVVQAGESQPFVEEIIENIPVIIKDLSPQQINTFYEAVGYMINEQSDNIIQGKLITSCMAVPNASWDNIIHMAKADVTVLQHPEHAKAISNFLKTNVSACSSIGSAFAVQIGRIFMDMLSVYKTVSGVISNTVATKGLVSTKTPIIRSLRTIKRDTLRLMDAYIVVAEDKQQAASVIVPQLFEAVLSDYHANVEPAKEAEVLKTVASIVTALGPLMMDKIAPVLDAVFECTLNMINKDFSEYPEHRAGFFNLIRAIVLYCFPALLQLPAPKFKLIMDSIVWAFKHTMRDNADTGLTIVYELLEHISQTDQNVANSFYQSYFLSLIQDIFYVLTDCDHKAGFKMQTTVLAHMFNLTSRGKITVPLYDPSQNPGCPDNVSFLKQYVGNLLMSAFPNLQSVQVETFVIGLHDLNEDPQQFKLHVRDFLISLKEFSTDNDELFLEERELEQERKKKAEMEAALKIPGMVKPSDQPDIMSD